MKKLLPGQMPMPCTQWAEKLAAAHTNDLSPEQRKALDQHIASCSDCAAVRAEYQEMDAFIAQLPAVAPLAGLPSQLQYIIEEQDNAEYQSGIVWEDIPPSLPLQHRSLPVRSISHMKHLTRVASAIAAVLVVGAILGSSLLLFQRYHSTMGSANWNCPVPAPLVFTDGPGNSQVKPVLSQSTLYAVNNGWDGRTSKDVQSIDSIHLNDGSKVRLYQTTHAYLSNMTIANGVIYAYVSPDTGNNFIYAIRTSDGAVLWHHSIPQFNSDVPLVVENGLLYVDSLSQYIDVFHVSDGDLVTQYKKIESYDFLLAVSNGLMYVQHGYELYVLQAEGHILWQFSGDDLNHAPDITVADGRVYVGADYGSIYILQASNGHLIHKIVQPLTSSFVPVDAPLVVDGTIYANAMGGYLYALQADDGSPLWCKKVNGSSTFLGSLTLTNGMIYASISSGQIDALDASNGKLLWQFQTESSGLVLPPIVHNGIVYAVTLDNTIYALRGSNGKVLWKSKA